MDFSSKTGASNCREDRIRTRDPLVPNRRRGFLFSVVYFAKRGEVLIVAFAHMKRKPGYWRRRAP